MRAILILAAALMFGVAGGYAWSDLARPAPHVHVPKVPKARPIVIPETSADQQWQERADAPEAAPEGQPNRASAD